MFPLSRWVCVRWLLVLGCSWRQILFPIARQVHFRLRRCRGCGSRRNARASRVGRFRDDSVDRRFTGSIFRALMWTAITKRLRWHRGRPYRVIRVWRRLVIECLARGEMGVCSVRSIVRLCIPSRIARSAKFGRSIARGWALHKRTSIRIPRCGRGMATTHVTARLVEVSGARPLLNCWCRPRLSRRLRRSWWLRPQTSLHAG